MYQSDIPISEPILLNNIETVTRIWEKNNVNKLFTTKDFESGIRMVVLKVINDRQAGGWCVVYKNYDRDNVAMFYKRINLFINEFKEIPKEDLC